MGGLQYGQVSSQTFGEEHQRRILSGIGLPIQAETVHDFLVYCPYHGNNDTPSLSISKNSGKFICFNPACAETGTIIDLVRQTKKLNPLEAMRFVIKFKPSEEDIFADQLKMILNKDDTFEPFSLSKLNELSERFPNSEGHEYMRGRGFNDDTLETFRVGYSERKRMVTVPVYSHTNVPVGIIGRAVEDKVFKNSVGLPSSRVFFNLNNARKHSSSVVVVESSFDAMKIHQAGFPNVIANISGHVSQYKLDLLSRYFTKVIIMTDNDKTQYRSICRPCGGVCRGHNPGRELGKTIANNFSREVLWSQYNNVEIYPHGAKDAGDMTESEIQQCIKNAVTDVEYRLVSMV